MDDILEQKTDLYSLDDIMDREAERASKWSTNWVRAQKAILSPEQYDAEEIIAAERDFVQTNPESNDLASKDVILTLGLPASIPLLSRYQYAHFDKERNAQKYYSGVTPFDFFTFSLDGLLMNETSEDDPAYNSAYVQLQQRAVGWGKMRQIEMRHLGDSPRKREEEEARLIQDLFLFCYLSTVLVSFQASYPQGNTVEVGAPLTVHIDLDVMTSLCTAVSRDLNVEIPFDARAFASKISPASGEIMGLEAQTSDVINRVKIVGDLLLLMRQAKRQNAYVVLDAEQLAQVEGTLRASDWLQVRLALQSYNYLLTFRPGKFGIKKPGYDAMTFKRAIDLLKGCAKLADSLGTLRDWQDMMMILGASGYETLAAPIFQKLARKVENRKEFMDDLCEHRARNQDYSSLGWEAVREGDSKLDWQYKMIVSNPPLAMRLLELITTPNVSSFYSACRLAALLAVKYPQTVFASFLSSRLFPDTEALIDPVRGSALRYMLESIEDRQKRQKFFTSIISGVKGTIPRTPELQERFVKMMQIYSLILGSQINISAGSGGADRQMAPDFPELEGLPDRDIDALKEYILKNRSIHISHEGNRLGKTGVDSPFEEIIAETKITRNKESKKYPLSLACNISMKMKSGSTMYLRMTKDNTLLFRIMQNNNTKEERPIEDGADDWRVSAKTANELTYFVLCKLRDVYVRRKPDLTAAPSQNDGASDIIPDGNADDVLPEVENSPGAVPDVTPEPEGPDAEQDDEVPTPSSDPLTPLREEHDQILDITDRAVGEMQMLPLNQDQQEEKTKALDATQKIAQNLEKAEQLLRPLREGKNLPDILTEDLADLIVYEKVMIEGEEYYKAVPFTQIYSRMKTGELSIDDVFVRTVRAFTQSLPYIKRYRATPLTETEALRQRVFREVCGPVRRDEPRHLRLTVKRKARHDDKVRLKMMLLTESGEGFGMNMDSKNKVLIFEADNTPANRAIFDMMRQRTDLDIRHETSMRIRNALNKNLHAARKRLVSPQLTGDEWRKADEHFRTVENRMKRLADFRAEQEALREIELRNRMQETAPGDAGTDLHLPQVFPFAQTFNRGQFASLGDLLFAQKKSNGKTKLSKGAARNGSKTAGQGKK